MKDSLHKVNKMLLTGWGIVAFTLTVAYVLELSKGSRTFLYFLVFLLLNILPLGSAFALYRKNKGSVLVKQAMVIGYVIFYGFVLYTGNTGLVFTYFLPILLLLLVTNDKKAVMLYGGLVFVINTGDVVSRIVFKSDTSAASIKDYEIRLILILLCVALAFYSTKVSAAISLSLERMLSAIQEAGKAISHQTNEIGISMEELMEATDTTMIAVREVSAGNAKTAESIQEQQMMSGNIQQAIEEASALSDGILDMSVNAAQAVRLGRDNMQGLYEATGETNEGSRLVSEKMENLREKTEQAIHIITLIRDVASQTNLLAYNASIEAARAGAAGKGFTVVAGEINSLSIQAKDATVRISEIIENLQKEALAVTEAIERTVTVSRRQNELIDATGKQLISIHDSVAAVEAKSRDQSEKMKEITYANEMIARSVTTISAIVQELAAGSEQTLQTTEQNKRITQDVNVAVETLNEEMKRLSVSEAT